MFMAEGELNNALLLTKLKLKNSRNKIVVVLGIYILMFLINFINTLMNLFRYQDKVMDFRFADNTIACTAGVIIAVIVMNIMYKQSNHYYSVFPQTNTSRFLSSQIIMYFWMVLIAFLSLVKYLLQYVFFWSLTLENTNIKLLYKFDIGFVISGFFVLLTYGFIMISVITLVAVLIRRFKIYSIIACVVFLAIVFTNLNKTIDVIRDKLGFLIRETNLGPFFSKGFTVWILVCCIAFVVNKYAKSIAVRTVVAGIVIVMLIGTGITFVNGDNTIINFSKRGVEAFHKTIEIDATNIKQGSKITIVSNFEDTDQMSIQCLDSDLFDSFKGKKIVLECVLPTYDRDCYNLDKYTNSNVTANLKENTLNISYTYDKNVKVVLIPPWTFMSQFEKYKGKDIYQKFYNHVTGGGNVFVRVE